jgi:O-antigen/teichoic acid export membrane protein
MVARLYAAGKLSELQRLINRSSRVAIGLSLVVALGICLFAKPFLLLFGRDFTPGIGLVWVLSCAELISAGAGSVGMVLIMTGHERAALRGSIVSAALVVVLSALLIPRWGAMGAAIADGVALGVVNLIWGWSLYRSTGLLATALPVSWLQRWKN